MDFSDYIIFVDESGDHGLMNIDPQYPVFVLAFCIFHKQHYMQTTVPTLQQFKFNHFGHDQVILHEREIRKDIGDFSFLKDKQRKTDFIDELTDIVVAQDFSLITTIICKPEYAQRYHDPVNPYHVALGYGLERVFYYLRSKGMVDKRTHVMVEARGKKEDNELELEFRRICDGGNYEGAQLPFEVVFLDKKSNCEGLQLADLVARPVGIHIIRPQQKNRSFDILEKKFYCNDHGSYLGWGMKCFP